MNITGKIIGFAPTTDTLRARAFYEGVLGLKFVCDEPFALVLRSGPNMVRVVPMKEVTPAPYTVLGWEVDDIVTDVKQLTERGVVFERYPWVTQDEMGIWHHESGDKVAWFKDPDGNVLSLSQHA